MAFQSWVARVILSGRKEKQKGGIPHDYPRKAYQIKAWITIIQSVLIKAKDVKAELLWKHSWKTYHWQNKN